MNNELTEMSLFFKLPLRMCLLRIKENREGGGGERSEAASLFFLIPGKIEINTRTHVVRSGIHFSFSFLLHCRSGRRNMN